MAKETKVNDNQKAMPADDEKSESIVSEKANSEKNVKAQKDLHIDLIKDFEDCQIKKELPAIYVGDTVKVGVKITEGNKERVQPYEGVVIAKRHGV